MYLGLYRLTGLNQDSQAAMVVYDVTNEESIRSLEDWISEFENNNPCDFIISIVGNKVPILIYSSNNPQFLIQVRDLLSKIFDYV